MIDPRVDQAAAVEWARSKIIELRSARQLKEQKWLDCFRAYNGEHNSKWVLKAIAEGNSHRYINLTFDAVETIKAQLAALLFSHRDWLRVEPGRHGGIMADDKDAQIIQLLLYWQMEQMKFRPEFMQLVTALVICGNWSWGLSWKIDWAVDYPHFYQAMQEWHTQTSILWMQYQQQQQEWQMAAAQAMAQGLPKPPPPQIQMPPAPPVSMLKAYEGPEFVAEPIFDYVQDPFANDPRTAFRAQRVWRTLAHLRKLARPNEQGYVVYDNLDLVAEIDRGKSSTGAIDWESQIALAFGHRLPRGAGVEIQECYGTMELPAAAIGGDTQGGNIIFPNYTMAFSHDGQLLRFEPVHTWSGDLPRNLAVLIPVPGQTYGYGLIEPALDCQDYANYRANQIIDAVDYALHPELKAVDDGVYDPTEPNRAGYTHMVRIMDNVQPIIKETRGIQIGMADFAAAKSEFQQITRATNPFNNPGAGKTATEVVRDTKITGSSIGEIAKHIETTALLPIIELMHQYDQQYLPEGYYVRVGQGDLAESMPVPPDKVRLKYDKRLTGSSDLMALQESIRNHMQMLTIVMGSPVAVAFADVPYLLKKLWRLMGNDDSDRAFIDREAATNLLTTWMQSPVMQQLLIQGGGGNGGLLGAGPSGTPEAADGGAGAGSAGVVPDGSTGIQGLVQLPGVNGRPADRGAGRPRMALQAGVR